MAKLVNIVRGTHRRRQLIVAVVAACLTSTTAVAYFTASSTPGASAPTATSASMPAGNAPSSVTASGSTVTVNWNQNSIRGQFVGAYTSGGYTIHRYATTGGTQASITNGTCSTSVSGSASALSCRETSVPDGNWSYTVTPTLYNWTGAESTSTPVTVASATLNNFSVTASPASITAGGTTSVTVVARDSSNHTLANYTGTIHFTSSDAQAALPADYTFTSADAGSKSFNVTLKTAGNPSVSVSDSGKVGTTNVGVIAAAPAVMAFGSQPTNATSGQAISPAVTVTLKDAFGNSASGNVAMSIATGSGTLSGTTNQATSGGTATFNDLSIDNAGSHTLKATSGSLSATSSAFSIAAGVATNLAWDSVTKTAGTLSTSCLFTCTVTALGNNQSVTAKVSVTDAAGNVVSNLGLGHSVIITVPQNQSGGSFTPNNSSVTLTVPASGAATTPSFTYNTKNGTAGNAWVDKLQASTSGGTAYTAATMTATKQ